jgi:hypothetical protein
MTDIDAYVQVAAATTWLSTHIVYPTLWTAATSAQQAAALIEASDSIDSLPLKGCKYADDITQPRAFPRWPDLAGQAVGGDETDFQSEIAYSTVPQEVLDACCLEALEILKQGSSGRMTLREQGVKSFSIGGKLQETFIDQAPPKILSKKARAKLSHWIAGIAEAV